VSVDIEFLKERLKGLEKEQRATITEAKAFSWLLREGLDLYERKTIEFRKLREWLGSLNKVMGKLDRVEMEMREARRQISLRGEEE